MAQFTKFSKDEVLTGRSLPNIYRSLFVLAEEFAVLGRIETTRTMISLLLSEYRSDWQVKQIRYLKFAFAEAGQWPDEIPESERSEEELGQLRPQVQPRIKDTEDEGADDASRLEQLLKLDEGQDHSTGGAAMGRSANLAEALAVSIRLASRNTSSIQEIEADAKVQEVLGHIAQRMHANSSIAYLAERRDNWRLLATGALARKIPVDEAKLDALAQEAIETFIDRFRNGRKPHPTEGKSINELLQELERNTKANAVTFYEEIGDDVPETLFSDPATDDDVSALERKLNVTLPDDYKEFLKISNGFAGTWNGYYLDPPLSGTDEIDWATPYADDMHIELHEPPTGVFEFFNVELPDGREWPAFEKPLQLGLFDVMDVWFLQPHETRKAIEAYSEAMRNPDLSDEIKRSVRKLVEARYGSWEEFEKTEWVVVELQDIETTPYGSFKQFLEEQVRKSSMGVWQGEGQKTAASLAYCCLAD